MVGIGVLLVVVEPLYDASGQGQRLGIQVVRTEHPYLPLQGDDEGIELVEGSAILLPLERGIEKVYHAVELRHAFLMPSQVMQRGSHLGLGAKGMRLLLLSQLMTDVDEFLRTLYPHHCVALHAGGVGQHLEHIELIEQIGLDGIMAEQAFADGPRRVVPDALRSAEQRVDLTVHQAEAIDTGSVHFSTKLAHVANHDRRIENLQRPHRLVGIDVHGRLLSIAFVHGPRPGAVVLRFHFLICPLATYSQDCKKGKEDGDMS